MYFRLMRQIVSILGFAVAIAGFSGFKANAHASPVSKPVAEQKTTSLATNQKIAQGFSPGRATRGGRSYIGVGGNIGLGGDTTLSEGAFSVITKIGLGRNFSVRPAALIRDNPVFLIPVTVDFVTQSVTGTPQQQLNVAPYLGAGALISTGDDDDLGFLLSGGVDVPLSNQVTATAGVNVGFINDTEVGLLLGVGYNF
ncbi:hypothetical protein QUB80_15070 [Chlorogloeopsis sp. ULAP01]|uniref:hypothetical protein n=1 Tax=Chlorogloeopsis sp. ULAP01 TaxID=3056483 RepID=UPI0025AAE68C|nr:hypothetical protein [Chlorogloeopsis sp. ULAP01]MDM9382023.1 hypothetical protein [Chlorogloeopsis sp. ULAP01]